MYLHQQVELLVARGSTEHILLEGTLTNSLPGLAGSPNATVSPRMRSPEPAFEAEALKRVEQLYRAQLTDDPADPAARISLAWCLFMQSLLRAGQESVLDALIDATEGGEERLGAVMDEATEQNATELLEDCLRQTMTVKHLTVDPAARRSAERILALVKLSGGASALTVAEGRTARLLGEVTREVLGHGGGRKLRRMPTRKPEP